MLRRNGLIIKKQVRLMFIKMGSLKMCEKFDDVIYKNDVRRATYMHVYLVNVYEILVKEVRVKY